MGPSTNLLDLGIIIYSLLSLVVVEAEYNQLLSRGHLLHEVVMPIEYLLLVEGLSRVVSEVVLLYVDVALLIVEQLYGVLLQVDIWS